MRVIVLKEQLIFLNRRWLGGIQPCPTLVTPLERRMITYLSVRISLEPLIDFCGIAVLIELNPMDIQRKNTRRATSHLVDLRETGISSLMLDSLLDFDCARGVAMVRFSSYISDARKQHIITSLRE